MKITKEIAEKFLINNNSVDLDKYTVLEDASAAELLSQVKGELFLLGLETLSDDAALALSKYSGLGINLLMSLGDTPGHAALKKVIDNKFKDSCEEFNPFSSDDLIDDSEEEHFIELDDCIDPAILSSYDRNTLTKTEREDFLEEWDHLLPASDNQITPYFQRIGPGLGNVAVELKRVFTRSLMPEFLRILPQVTGNLIKKAFLDVKVYPKGNELGVWQEMNQWSGELIVVFGFVLELPPGKTLDEETEETLRNLFNEGGPLAEYLNAKLVEEQMWGEFFLSDFNHDSFSNFYLYVTTTGCTKSKYSKIEQASFGLPIRHLRESKKHSSKALFKFDYQKESASQMRELIAILSEKISGIYLDPNKLENNDSLFALMGFNDELTISLEKSITGTFNIIGGSMRLLTVENAIDFANEMKEYKSDE